MTFHNWPLRVDILPKIHFSHLNQTDTRFKYGLGEWRKTITITCHLDPTRPRSTLLICPDSVCERRYPTVERHTPSVTESILSSYGSRKGLSRTELPRSADTMLSIRRTSEHYEDCSSGLSEEKVLNSLGLVLGKSESS